MPHEVESMTFAGTAPWHGLGTALGEDDLYDWPGASAKAGLDWEAELVPLVTADTGAKVTHKAVRRKTNGRVLGVVGPRYAVLQNRDAFAWFEPFLQAKEATLHTAGSLRHGSRIWVLAKLNRDPLVIAQGDEVEKYLLLSHSHDGSLAVRVGFTPVRVVCANTLAMAHGADASKLIRVKHTRDVHDNLANVREVIHLADAEFRATAEQYRRLARKSINQADLPKYVRRVLKVEDGDTASTRLKNIAEEIARLAEVGRGNDLPSVRGTYWAAYNGFSEWLTHERGRSDESRTGNPTEGAGTSQPAAVPKQPRSNMMQWFNVDKQGLGRQAEEQGKGRLVGELIQSALDEPGVTQIAVSLAPVPGQELADLSVEDDAPEGFHDLTHAYTLFAPSAKRGSGSSTRPTTSPPATGRASRTSTCSGSATSSSSRGSPRK